MQREIEELKSQLESFENKVTFKAGGGNVYGGTTKLCYSSGSCEVVAPNATKSNYYLDYWQKKGGSETVKAGEKVTITDGDVFNAVWTEKKTDTTPNNGGN